MGTGAGTHPGSNAGTEAANLQELLPGAHPETRTPTHDATPGAVPHPLCFHGHIRGLDALRGAAILGVVLCHAFATSTDWTRWHGLAAAFIAFTYVGHLGVHLFFLLSGFLITGILLDSTQAPHRARSFYSRRARRILPAYLLLLATLLALHQVSWHFALAGALFVVNMGRLVGAQLSQYSILWSLAVEEQFYLLWPLLLWRANPRTVARVLLACLVLTPLLRLGLAALGQDAYYKTWANLDYLMDGALIAWALRQGLLHSGNIRLVTRWLYAGAAAGLLLGLSIWRLGGNATWVLALFVSLGRTQDMLFFMALLLTALSAHHRAQTGTSSEALQACARPGEHPDSQDWPAAPAAPPVFSPDHGHPAPTDQTEAPAADPVPSSTAILPQTASAPQSSRTSRSQGWNAQTLGFLGYLSYGLYLVHLLVFRLYDQHVAGTPLARWQQSFSFLALRALLCFIASTLLAWLSRTTLEAWFLRRKPAPARGPAGIAP